MAHLLGCENASVEYPAKRVLDSVTLGIDEGDRIGIVGANGDGKSTLLSLLSGSLSPDEGRVTARSGTTVCVLGQADELDPEASVAHSVVGAVPEHTWASDPRVRGIIGSLLAEVDWNGRVGDLSGGQRRRVDLARVLIAESDVLMLDEPTNHLDMHAIAWLAAHLKTRWTARSGALLVVTHDRWFLDEVCSQMWEVHDGQVDRFEGGYSAYVLQRVERAEATRLAEQKRRNLMRKELAWLSHGPPARSTKPKFRVDAARALVADEPPPRNSLELKRSAISRLGKQVVDLIGVSARFAERTVIDDVTWQIGPGDRIGILGENGSGKTTLLNLMRGALEPTAGKVKIGASVRFAVLTQDLAELTELSHLRVREVLARHKARYEIDGRELTPAQLLERLGFENAHLSAYVSALSGGQRRRLQLMLILLDKPNVLILDEPGNDLDTDMLAQVESLLDTWPGTLLLVTHDRHLMERVTDDQFALLSGKVRHVPGGVDQYLRLLETRDAARVSTTSDQPRTAKRSAGSDDRRLKKELASTERKIQTLEKRVEALHAEMDETDPTDYEALLDVQARLRALEDQLAQMEDVWLTISEQLA